MAATRSVWSYAVSTLTATARSHHLRIAQRACCQRRRGFQTAAPGSRRVPDFAFAFDIDGVLVHSSTPIPGATETLRFLQSKQIPFILLTNGGGKTETERIADLSKRLDVPLDTNLFVQSHTPFADLAPSYRDKTVLVVGGDYNKSREAAEAYGFNSVVTPGDLIVAQPELWPFARNFMDYYKQFAKPLPKPMISETLQPTPEELAASLKIDAIFVYNDPRDWGLDATVILDALLSHAGHIGTVSTKNGDLYLPNNGYQQDDQPALYFSNPDLWWSSAYHLSRLGQGGFQAAFRGLWAAATDNAKLTHTVIGKPTQQTYEFAEARLRAHRKTLFGQVGLNDPLRRVYMIGDNPESDIAGANGYDSPYGSQWSSVLVRTGVWREEKGAPRHTPKQICKDVYEAVQWGLKDAGWEGEA